MATDSNPVAQSTAEPVDTDEDPIVHSYDVYITAPLPEYDAIGHALYLVQYPNRDRDQPYNSANGCLPSELRIKPNTGFMEVDVPLQSGPMYNASKAQEWGDALKNTKDEGVLGFGLASGLPAAMPRGGRRGGRGRGGATSRARGPGDGAQVKLDEDNKGVEHATNGPNLAHQTLGGQIAAQEQDTSRYMVGTFIGDQLHLTPLKGISQLRPNFHHLDAKSHVERMDGIRRDREAAAMAKAAEADPSKPPSALQPRLVQMQVKTAAEAGNLEGTRLGTKDILQNGMEEPWTKMNYRDEEETIAYDLYHNKLFLNSIKTNMELQANTEPGSLWDSTGKNPEDKKKKPGSPRAERKAASPVDRKGKKRRVD